MAKRSEGIPAQQLEDDELENELRQLYRTREETFFHGSAQAFKRHTDRMLELEGEYASRKPASVEPEPERTRAGARKDSPLHAAIWRARHETAKLLIARGAPLEQRNGHRETPLSYAVRAALQSEWTRERSAETVEALLAAGADAREVGLPTGWPPLDTLIERHLPGR